MDATFCFACRHFLGGGGHWFHSEPAFSNGYKNWKHATAAFKKHDASAAHKFAMEAWAEFKLATTDGSRLGNMIDAGHSKIVQENRENMRAVVLSLRYTACQGIAQRGHREDEESESKGNFVELLNVIGEFDKTAEKKLKDNPRKTRFLRLWLT